MRKRMWMAAAVLTLPTLALAHGEDDPGPHGGEIRMPGAFHVEALARDGALVVYLLNMQFEAPRVANSSVDAAIKRGEKRMELSCAAANANKAFRCPLPGDATLKRGTLAVDATRDGMPADTAEYELPLAWSRHSP